MYVRLILPALAEAVAPHYRSIKYALFPPLGLATLAGHLGEDDRVTIEDEHVEPVDLVEEDLPDLVAIQVYITSARRAYEIADHYRGLGVHVALGGLHVTSLPDEAAQHADTILLGPGEDIWPAFLADLRAGRPARVYRSRVRTLEGAPPPRRDLLRRDRYLVPNSIVVSRGCPHACDFCYKEAFYRGGRSFYTRSVDAALEEIDALPGRHLFFLDDNLFGNPPFAAALFDTAASRDRLKALVRGYFDLGGMQLQINVVDQEVLRRACEHPEDYPDLVVRIGGYSEYFHRLSPELRQSLLERTEHR